MATTYGMGQYRMQSNETYMTQINGNNNDNSFSSSSIDVKVNTYIYKDIYFDLGENKNFEYGKVYYLELSLPRHPLYTSDIDIKICGTMNGKIDIENQFQNIKQIIVPSSLANSNYYKDILLYVDPNSSPENEISKVGIVNDDIVKSIDGNYYLNSKKIEKYQSVRVTESWKLKNTGDDTILYKMIFSPKFNNTTYHYLYLQIDRNNEWNTNIQYIDNGIAYRGITIDNSKVTLNIYEVTNLLNNVNAIKQNSLNHIGVWGHPEMYLAINGEQIQIGRTGFYELNDFNITNLGVIATKEDRFSIDYEFIISDDEEGE